MLLYHGADKTVVGQHGTPKEVALHEKQLGPLTLSLSLSLSLFLSLSFSFSLSLSLSI